jgi:hypothetical protein
LDLKWWKKEECEEINYLEDEMAETCSTHGETRNAYKNWLGKLKRRDHWETQAYGRIILNWILKK